jgi:hypothetical protein
MFAPWALHAVFSNCSIDLEENNDQSYQLELGKDRLHQPLSL